jgi:hypothetical protein
MSEFEGLVEVRQREKGILSRTREKGTFVETWIYNILGDILLVEERKTRTESGS